jgi:mono/diheme cytochrome c family protein
MIKLLFTFIFFLVFNNPLYADTLLIESSTINKAYTTESLLKNKHTKTIKIPSDPSYKNEPGEFKAIPLNILFKEYKLNNEMVIQFHCTDGFSAPFNTTLALNSKPDKSIAYLAIEEPNNKWTNLPKKKLGAGPFRIVWVNPEKSNIVQEQWPYMISSFSIKESLKASYPKIYPSDTLEANHDAHKGFKVFLNNCFACHRMNKQGEGEIGPDLNHPMNPTEYFQVDALKKLIRNPSDVRTWKTSKMPDFDKSEISDKDIDDLVAYLEHMSSQR